MPIPEPNEDESKDEFISRCISAISDEYDSEQAAGICYSQWDESKKSDDSSDTKVKTLHPIRFIKKAEDDDGFYIGGYANVYMLDEDGKIIPDFDDDVITLEALDEGIKTMMNDPSRRNHMYYHTNIQIGEILEEYTDSEGVLWKTHVVYEPDEQYPKKGLFIICRLFDDNPLSLEAMEVMKRGHMLAFSVGGIPLEERQVCDDDKCWNEISKFYLAEVSSCERGINAESKGFILKLSKDTQIYYSSVDNNSNGYISETMKTNIDDVELSIIDSELNITSDKDGELNVTSEQKEENNLTENKDKKPCECTDAEIVEKVKSLAESMKAEVAPEELIDALASLLWLDPEALKTILAPLIKGETEMTENQEDLNPEVKDEEPTEPVEKEIETFSDEPRREDYASFSEYAEAVVAYDAAQKAKTPATKKEVEELKTVIAELKKMLEEKTSEESIGEVVKKSRRVEQKTPDDFEIDIDAKLAMITKSQKPRGKLE